jgi:NarL family two-component system response regulator LiaR
MKANLWLIRSSWKIVFPDLQPHSGEIHLSKREREILKLVASGMSYNAIADNLGISLSTVKFHIGNILSKLKVETRSEAIVVATKNGLI